MIETREVMGGMIQYGDGWAFCKTCELKVRGSFRCPECGMKMRRKPLRAKFKAKGKPGARGP